MAVKESKIFHITINDWVFFDPKFTKNYAGFFPISRKFYSSKVVGKLTNAQFTYLIALIDLAHTYRSPSFDLPETLLRANGQLVETLLYRLQENQVLSFLINKEIKELSNKENSPQKLPENYSITKDEKLTNHWFYKFLFEELNYADLGFLNYLPKIEKGFVNEESFRAWLDLLITAQNFQKADLKGQNKYIIKSIKDELVSRGIR